MLLRSKYYKAYGNDYGGKSPTWTTTSLKGRSERCSPIHIGYLCKNIAE